MLALLLLVSLGQVPLVPVPEAPGMGEPSVVPASEGAPQPAEAQNKATLARRIGLSGALGVVGAGAGLGIALAFSLPNPSFDARFATTALCTLMVTGGVFLAHEALGGHGEVMLGLLGSLAAMVGAALIANTIDPTVPMAPILTAAIGALPAAALTVLGLEGTSPLYRPGLKVAVGPGSVLVQF